jgi:hypothetical protein
MAEIANAGEAQIREQQAAAKRMAVDGQAAGDSEAKNTARQAELNREARPAEGVQGGRVKAETGADYLEQQR